MEYHEIGEQFECDSTLLIVREFDKIRDNRCGGCFFEFYGRRDLCPSVHRCRPEFREDHKNVYFELIYFINHRREVDKFMAINTESKKNDRLDDKPRWELLPLEDVEDIVRVYTAGAKKYGPDQWQNLPDGIRRYKAALLRHLVEFDKGNEIDEETGCRHLAQCAWNAIAMLHISKHKKQ